MISVALVVVFAAVILVVVVVVVVESHPLHVLSHSSEWVIHKSNDKIV